MRKGWREFCWSEDGQRPPAVFGPTKLPPSWTADKCEKLSLQGLSQLPCHIECVSYQLVTKIRVDIVFQTKNTYFAPTDLTDLFKFKERKSANFFFKGNKSVKSGDGERPCSVRVCLKIFQVRRKSVFQGLWIIHFALGTRGAQGPPPFGFLWGVIVRARRSQTDLFEMMARIT